MTDGPTPPVTVVVVTHDGPGELLGACLRTLDAADGHDEVIVVDNGAGPDRPRADYGPGVTHVIRTPNRGYGAAANAGFTWALERSRPGDRRLLALLNDDVEVDPGWLRPLVDAVTADPRIGAAQPKLLFADTNPVVVNSLGVELDRFGAGVDIGHGLVDDDAAGPRAGEARDIAIFTGGAVVLSDAFVQDTGGFDERFFLYYEDVDLALRGARSGWRYRCVPAGTVHHVQGASTERLGDDLVRHREQNRLRAAVRFGGPALVGRAYWLSIRKLRHAPRAVHARALLRGIALAPAELGTRVLARAGIGRPRRGAIVVADV